MIPLDKNTLFSIFEAGDEEIYKEHGLEDQLKNPFVLMGMIVKGLENFDMMDMLYTKRYPEHYKNVRDMTKYKYYSKLYRYLERIDTKNFNEKYTVGDSFGRENCFVALENMLRYFEKIEQYEKCAIIKRYQTLLLESLVDGK